MENQTKTSGSRWNGAELVAGFLASGKTRAEYCQEIGITVAKLDYHRHQARRCGPARLVPVHIKSANPGGAWDGIIKSVGVILRNGRKLDLAWQGDDSGLHQLLAVLERE